MYIPPPGIEMFACAGAESSALTAIAIAAMVV